MLSSSPNGSVLRKYRNREQLVGCVAAVAVVNVINLAAITDGVDGVAFLAGRIAFSVVFTIAGLRAGFSSLTATEDGVRVANTFSNFALRWNEIERFEIGRWRFLPYACLIHRRDGRRMHSTGIQEARIGNGSAAEIVDGLNAELARRTQTPVSA